MFRHSMPQSVLSGIAIAISAPIAIQAIAAVKPGEWETRIQQSTHAMSAEGALAPDAAARLKNLPPEMQARVRAAIAKAQSGQSMIHHSCVTPEQAARNGFNVQNPRSGCKVTTVSQSATRTQQSISCTGPRDSNTGQMVTEIISPVLVRGSITMQNGRGNMSQQWTSRWVGPACSAQDRR